MKIKGKKFTYLKIKKRLPTGQTTTLELIEHPGAALIVPFIGINKVIFLRQYRAVLGKYLYELPAGTLDKKESVLACAKRELIEETGFGAQYFKSIGKIYPVPGYSTEVIYIFKAEKLFKSKAQQDPDEIIRPMIFTKKKLQQYFKAGRIMDAKSICALALCGWL